MPTGGAGGLSAPCVTFPRPPQRILLRKHLGVLNFQPLDIRFVVWYYTYRAKGGEGNDEGREGCEMPTVWAAAGVLNIIISIATKYALWHTNNVASNRFANDVLRNLLLLCSSNPS